MAYAERPRFPVMVIDLLSFYLPMKPRAWCLMFVCRFTVVFVLALRPANATDALQLFKNYFVTGDYAIGGVGLRGLGVPDPITQAAVGGTILNYARGTIRVSGVPENADIVAAFLYWQTLESATEPSGAAGTFLGKKIVGKQIAPVGALGCRSSGGGAGSGNNPQKLRNYRADVLRFLPVSTMPNGAPAGQRQMNGVDFTVALPDTGAGGSNSSGTNNQATLLQGASLVVVYRVGHKDPNYPLRSIVLYEAATRWTRITAA